MSGELLSAPPACPECGHVPAPEDAALARCVTCYARREDLGIRSRLFVEGELADEKWLPTYGTREHLDAEVRALIAHQTALADAATAAGQRWHVELFNPWLPCESAYTRFGHGVTP